MPRNEFRGGAALRPALDDGWDEIGRELALADAWAFASAFSQDQGSAAVQAQATILLDVVKRQGAQIEDQGARLAALAAKVPSITS